MCTHGTHSAIACGESSVISKFNYDKNDGDCNVVLDHISFIWVVA